MNRYFRLPSIRVLAGFVFGFLLAGAAQGADWWLKSGTVNWSDANSYTNASGASPAQVPGSDDTVYLPNETFEVESTSPSFETLSSFYRLVPATGSRLVVTVPPGEISTLGCAFNQGGETGSGCQYGEIVKKGAGMLKFGTSGRILSASTKYAYDYCTKTILAEGSLQTTKDAPSVERSHTGIIVSSNDTTLIVTSDPSRTRSAWLELDNFDFGGLVTNETPGVTTVIFTSSSGLGVSKVRGPIGGNIRFWLSGSVDFLSTDLTFTGGVTAQGWNGSEIQGQSGNVGVMKFGLKGAGSSSLGTSPTHMSHDDGIFHYLGTEAEETDVGLYCYGSLGLDGGAYGALTFKGTIYSARDSMSNSGQHRMLFCGENEHPCVFSGTMTSNLDNDNTSVDPEYSCYVTKRGSGTWTFRGRKNGGQKGWNGGLAVEAGTLQFDSLLEAGRDCSLGTALALTDGHRGLWSEEHWVDYAIVLGSVAPASAAVLEYVGTGPAVCSTRPIVLAGEGGTLRANAGRLSFSGISARDENASPTLTLDGTGDRNVVKGISDGAAGAKVSVAKDGAGTWSLDGDLTFSGDLTVKEGTLKVNVPDADLLTPVYKDYKWFKLSIAELTDSSGTRTSGGTTLAVRQISLLDKDGNRQNLGLTVPASAYNGNKVCAVNLQPGEACFGEEMVNGSVDSIAKNLSICFDGTYSSSDKNKAPGNPNADAASIGYIPEGAGAKVAPVWTDQSTWIVIKMRLLDSATPVTHFDIQAFNEKYKQAPCRFQLDASVDGKEWTTVWTNVDAEKYDAYEVMNEGYNRWISDGKSGSAINRPEGTGFSLSQSGEDYLEKHFFNWFRLSIAKIHGDVNDLYIRQIGLYDEAGNRVNVGLKLAENVQPVENVMRPIPSLEIAAGQCGYDAAVAGYRVTPKNPGVSQTVIDLAAAFFGPTGEGGTEGRYEINWFDPAGNAMVPTPSDQKTWIPIVMHLADGAAPVTQFDVQAFNYNVSKLLIPVRMKLEGSIDGENWVEAWSNLDDQDDLSPDFSGATYNQWIGRKCAASRTDIGAKGFQLTNTYWTVRQHFDQLQNVRAIEVKAGSKLVAVNPLTVKSLRLDTTGAGSFSNLVFAASGNLDIVSAKSPAGVLPGTYVGCRDLAHLENWTVSVNGIPKADYKITVSDDGKVSVTRPGLLLIVR